MNDTGSYGRVCWEANVVILSYVFTLRVWLPCPKTPTSFVFNLVVSEWNAALLCMFRKLFHKSGYQRKFLQYYRLTQTVFFLPPERLQWQSKEISLFYSSHFSVTQFSVFQRSISSWSGTWIGAKGRSSHSYICCWRQWTGSTDAHCQLLSSATKYGRCGGHILHLHCEINEDCLLGIRWLCVY